MDLDKSTEAYELAFEAMTRFATIAKLTEAFPRGAGREPLQRSSTNTMMRHHRWRAILRSDDVAHAFSAYYDGAVGLLVANALSGITLKEDAANDNPRRITSMGKPSYSNAIAAIYEAAAQPDLWPSALELIADYVGADSGMLLYLPASRDNGFIISGRLREDLNHLFLKHHTKNPYGCAFARAPIDRALATDMVVRKDILHRSAFYADILAPQGISEIVAVRHSSLSGEGPGGILFNLSAAQTNDAENALARLDELKSHLSRAIDLTILASRLPAEKRHLDQVLATVSGAVVLLDQHGGILRMTSNAETLLRQSDGLVVVKSDPLTLAAQTHADSLRFAASLKQALAVAKGEETSLEGLMQIERPSGRRALLIRMTPLLPQTLSPWNAFDAMAHVMVQIVDPQASAEAQAEHLRLLVGLSAAETRVAALLGGGLGLPETARVLGVSLSTVKTHTKRIFHKADVHSSTALVRLLASIPIGPPG